MNNVGYLDKYSTKLYLTSIRKTIIREELSIIWQKQRLLGIDREKVEANDSFWKELNYQRYPLEYKRVGWFRRASVIRKKRANEKIPDVKEYGEIKKYDVIVTGGGPSGTLYASMLAQKGYSVLLIERNTNHECGSTWNLSSSEFEDLKSTKALTEKQFEGLIAGKFEQGDFRLWNEKEENGNFIAHNFKSQKLN